MTRALLCWLVVLVVVLVAAQVGAQDADARDADARDTDARDADARDADARDADARDADAGPHAADADALYHEGVAALEAGESDRALPLFRRAFELAPNAERGLALAATLQQRGELSGAIELYDRILFGELGELDADRRAALETARQQADDARAVLHVQVRGDALDVELDGRAVGTVRRGAALTLRLDPGSYQIRGGIEGRFGPVTSVELSRGESRDVTLAPEQADSEVDADADSEVDADAESAESVTDAHSTPAPWIVVGLSAVPAAIGIATGVRFNVQVDRAQDAGNHRDAQPHLDDARPLGRAANASFAIAGAFAITGIVWGIVSRTKRNDDRVEVGMGVVRGVF